MTIISAKVGRRQKQLVIEQAQRRNPHNQTRAQRSAEEKLLYLSQVRTLTPRYARRVHHDTTKPKTKILLKRPFGLKPYDLKVVRLDLETHGHQRRVYLDARGRYWVPVGLTDYSRVPVEYFETWELMALSRLLDRRLYGNV